MTVLEQIVSNYPAEWTSQQIADAMNAPVVKLKTEARITAGMLVTPEWFGPTRGMEMLRVLDALAKDSTNRVQGLFLLANGYLYGRGIDVADLAIRPLVSDVIGAVANVVEVQKLLDFGVESSASIAEQYGVAPITAGQVDVLRWRALMHHELESLRQQQAERDQAAYDWIESSTDISKGAGELAAIYRGE